MKTPLVMADEVLMPGVQYLLIYDHRTLSELYSVLCETDECDLYQNFSTTETCIDAFEKYFKKSGGNLPDCIPKFPEMQPEDPFPFNELWGYANIRFLVREDCDPIYDPTVDVAGIINNSNLTPTPYEICLKNKAAQYDVLMLSVDMYCMSYCSSTYMSPCYREFNITGDQIALDICLADAQPLIDQCLLNPPPCGDTYLYQNKTCIGGCRDQYTDTCFDEYNVTGDTDTLNACLENARPFVDQCIIDECGGYKRIYPGYIIIN